ncbi:G-protein coupled receptor 54-like [Diadema antillarum]|uniref:G-protein coupled receptor 54-like n=1 Tax=Diadema antillarum TaxID=105358 RepID=UPI003A84FB70
MEDALLPYDDGTSLSSYIFNYSNLPPLRPTLGPTSIIVPMILAIVLIVAVVGNSFVIYIVLRYRNMRNSVTNFYIMNVAVGDLVFVIVCVPLTCFLYAHYTWTLGSFMCKFNAFAMTVSVQATCATLTVMTVDRYYVITHPFTSRQTRTTFRAGVICSIIWIVSGLMHIPSTLVFGTTSPGVYRFQDAEIILCTTTHKSDNFIKYNSLYVLAVTYVSPLAIISVCYGLILAHLWKVSRSGMIVSSTGGKSTHRRGRGVDGCNNNSTHRNHSEGSSVQTATKKWKTTRIVLIVVMLFAICWAPIHAINLWNDVDPNFPQDSDHVYAFRIFGLIFSYANSCVNPVVYALAGNSFRVHLREMFHIKPKHKPDVCIKSASNSAAFSMQRHSRKNSHTEQMSMTANTSV